MLTARGYVFYKCPFVKDAAVSIFTTQTWRGQLTKYFISTGAIYKSVQLLRLSNATCVSQRKIPESHFESLDSHIAPPSELLSSSEQVLGTQIFSCKVNKPAMFTPSNT